ncbi:PREDICTED: fetal and adult testis-expressed transcript protein [Chinchilla lanigera]|uniref:Mff-like domain-containing protein n=1 Tax=Chinchilla lanigera TaxID=34839 RepID=A0A8C2UI02_CHILA|nr:PREDICTED: fetal and adult testis-expressed transcript protein [Chinchilla lanigera]
MAAGPPSTKEETERCINEELVRGSPGRGQDHLMIADVLDHASRSGAVSQRRQKTETKATVSILPKSAWNVNPRKARKMEHQQQVSRISREPGHSGFFQEYPGIFQDHRDQNLGIDLLTETDPDELNGLELEIIRRQLLLVTERLCVLEDQDSSWRFKEAVLFTAVLTACLTNLWLWMRQ